MIDKPVDGVTTDARPHPAGAKGARLSLHEVAERAWKARMSPRFRAWVSQALAEAGVSTGTRKQQAQAILSAFQKKVPYLADPLMGEFMATPDQLLCLDEGGLCIVGGDCDEVSITLAAALMSIAIPVMIVGSSHRPPHDVPTHVFIAFQDELKNWIRIDGTLPNAKVGKISPNAREWWVEPGEHAKETGQGDFVGMSGRGEDGTLGAPAKSNILDFLYPNVR